MQPYLLIAAPTQEPEGWDAAHVLQLLNPITGTWSCPTVTERHRRCENVVSQQRSTKATFMLNSMSVEDPGMIAKDDDRELTDLAGTMICSVHSRGSDSEERVKGVVAQWKNYIKTLMRQQVQPRSLNMKAPANEYQTSNASAGLRGQHINAFPEQAAAVPQAHARVQPTALDSSPAAQSPPPSYGATFDPAALGDIMGSFQALVLQNQQLREQNKKLREKNAQITEERNAAAAEHKRARGELEAVEEQRDALGDQVDEQFREINSLRDREETHLEMISKLKETLQKTSRAYRRLKKVWTAASVVPKGEV